LHNVEYPVQHRVRFEQYLPIIEPQHLQSAVIQVIGSDLVVVRVPWLEMLGSIHLYNQLRSRSEKIDDVRTDRLLAIELYAQYLLSAEPGPEMPLSIGHLAPQSARNLF
jgi:hypothetical protein